MFRRQEDLDPRPVLCDRLRSLGVNTSLAEDPELIDLDHPDIRQVLIEDPDIDKTTPDTIASGIINVSAGGGGIYFFSRSISYLVLNSRIEPNFPVHSIASINVRKGTFGTVVRHRWKAIVGKGREKNRNLWTEVILRLRQDSSLTEGIASTNRKSGDNLSINVVPERGCWAITKRWVDRGSTAALGPSKQYPSSLADAIAKRIPTAEEWKCYQAIGSHLLAALVSSKA